MADPLIVWVDTETTGLDPRRCQVLEVGLVPTVGGVVRDDLAAECHVEHPLLTYQPARLLGMGHGLDRRPGVPLRPAAELDGWLFAALAACWRAVAPGRPLAESGRLVLGGKNPWFDLAFLRRLCPLSCRLVRHRLVDAGTLYLRPADAVPPDLAETLRRAGLPDRVEHTALADARACAAAYSVWRQRHVMLEALADRVAAQSELLSRRAEGPVAGD
jgi:DNA polymerase III epsilon subunit-like protein